MSDRHDGGRPDERDSGDGPGEKPVHGDERDHDGAPDDAPVRPVDGREGETGSGAADASADVPVWDDEYLERVSSRLMHHYTLERDHRAGGDVFDLYGLLEVHSQKHFLHPSLSYASHESTEHLFAKRVPGVSVADLERYVSLGHDLADERIDASEEHYGTEFTFALVAPALPADVLAFVSGFRDRTLLKFGYYGDYEVNLLVVAPAEEAVVASRSTDLDEAFALWRSPGESSGGLLDRLF